MKILLFDYRDMRHPEAGGAEVIMQEIFERLAARGHEVAFVTGGFPGGAARETRNGIRIHRVGNTFDFNFAAPSFYRKKLRAEGWDCLVEDLNKIPLFLPAYERNVPTLCVVPHLFGTTVFEQASLPIATYVYLYERFIPWVYRDCLFSVLSDSTREDLIGRGIRPDHVRVIRSGMDHGSYTPSPIPVAGREPIVVYLGRIKKYKCIDHPIRALPEIRRHVPNARLVVAGDGDHLPALRRLVASLGLEGAVEFPGHLSGKAKLDLLGRARVLAYTSPKEGWGLSVIEAGAVGVPVVASRSPGLRESVVDGKTGFLVPHGDIPKLAETIRILLTDDAIAESCAREGIEWAKMFTWERAADETLALIEESVRRAHATMGFKESRMEARG